MSEKSDAQLDAEAEGRCEPLEAAITSHRDMMRDDARIDRLVSRQPPTTRDPNTGIVTFSETHTITGGTGRFKRASGELHIVGSATPSGQRSNPKSWLIDSAGEPLAAPSRLTDTPTDSMIPAIEPWRDGFALAWDEVAPAPGTGRGEDTRAEVVFTIVH